MLEVVEVFSAHKFILQIYQTVNFVIRVGPEGLGRKSVVVAGVLPPPVVDPSVGACITNPNVFALVGYRHTFVFCSI
jgi:hypothetical protein